MSILDEPIKQRCPSGYPYCPKCWRYEHHYPHFTVCQGRGAKWDGPICGVKLEVAFDMTWREFIKQTAHAGSGPVNTIHSLLQRELCERKHLNMNDQQTWSDTLDSNKWPSDLKEQMKETRALEDEYGA